MSDSSTETLGKLNNTEAPEESNNTEAPEELNNTKAPEESNGREALENLYNTEQTYGIETGENKDADQSGSLADLAKAHGPLILGGIVLLVAVLTAAVLLVRKKRKENKKSRNAASAGGEVRRQTAPAQDGDIPEAVEKIRVGKLHNIGKREQQKDSLGVADTADGVFAVIADGMGGLSDGDKVSQKIVMTMLQDAAPMPGDGRTPGLFEMVAHANEEVNRMLGVQNQYQSGSTVVAVMACPESFTWVSVGDSRICLYRNGRLIQLNREHTYEAELLQQAVNQEISFEEARRHPKRRGLTSFIGMGKLKYIDGSARGVPVQEGDMLLLMSDGVFHTLSEQEICDIIQSCGDCRQAAAAMEKRILEYQKPKQDNFTAIILEF